MPDSTLITSRSAKGQTALRALLPHTDLDRGRTKGLGPDRRPRPPTAPHVILGCCGRRSNPPCPTPESQPSTGSSTALKPFLVATHQRTINVPLDGPYNGKASARSGRLTKVNETFEEVADEQDRLFTSAQVADLLGISASRVTHRLNNGTLFALPPTRRDVSRLFPTWQFDGSRVVPHLDLVVAELPTWFTAADTAGFFTNGQIELPSGDSQTVRHLLLSGGDVDRAVELAHGLTVGL